MPPMTDETIDNQGPITEEGRALANAVNVRPGAITYQAHCGHVSRIM